MTIVRYDRQPWFTRADVGVEDDPVRDHPIASARWLSGGQLALQFDTASEQNSHWKIRSEVDREYTPRAR
jgi:hypothetical protein